MRPVWLIVLLASAGCVSSYDLDHSSLRDSTGVEWAAVTTQTSERLEIMNAVVHGDSLIGFEMKGGRRGDRVAIPLMEISELSGKHFDATRTFVWYGIASTGFLVTWMFVNANL